MVRILAISKYVNSLLEIETKFSAQQAISDGTGQLMGGWVLKRPFQANEKGANTSITL
jgi:hypothetical protein